MKKHRAEIDGLRALAVLPVIFFHGGFITFSGGFVGVDVFFVISGYLITGIIRSELEKGTFTLVHFYERRARRILPALFFVLFVTIPLAFFIMMPSQLKDFGQALLATSLYVSNILFWLKSGYFEPSGELNPLLHTWSLAVEEQYYIFYPLMLMLLWKFGTKMVITAICVIGLASLAFAEWSSFFYPSANFFLLTSRAWELMIGGILGMGVIRQVNSGPLAEVGGAIGIALIFTSIFLFDEATRFPSFYALMPTLGTACIIFFTSPSTMVGRFLGIKPIVGVGLISYSAYLWQQPLFAFARLSSLTEPSRLLMLILVFVSLGLAYFTWKYVETPFRDPTRMRAKRIWLPAACATVFAVALGLTGHLTDGLQSIKNRLAGAAFAPYIEQLNEAHKERFKLLDERLIDADRPFAAESNGRRVLVIGDSLATDLYITLSLLGDRIDLGEYQFRLLQFDNSCIDRMYEKSPDKCGRQSEALRNSGLPQAADLILISAAWENRDADKITLLLDYLGNKPIIVYGPAAFEHIESMLYHVSKRSIPVDEWPYEFARFKHEASVSATESLRLTAEQYGIKFVDKYDLFCREDEPGLRCDLVDAEGAFLIVDQSHVSILGAVHYGDEIMQRGWLTP